jgi:transposase
MLKIKQELCENPSGWQAKQVMDIIDKKTGVRYHEVHLQTTSQMGLFAKGFSKKIC